MTAFVLIATLLSPPLWWNVYAVGQTRPLVAYFATYAACNAALNGLAAVHGDRLVGACYATGERP